MSAARKAWNEAMRATAGAILPPSLQQGRLKRRSDRQKKQERRTKARKVQTLTSEGEEYRTAVWVDALEGVDPNITVEEDEEYDELDDFLQDNKQKKKRRGGSTNKQTGVFPKRFLPLSLAHILLEDASREDGAAHAFIEAEARVPPGKQLPRRKFCPVTGTPGIYTEPRTGIPYSSLRALDQIRERPPPWMTLNGQAAFWEAAKSIREDD